jgi:hypothetical protein
MSEHRFTSISRLALGVACAVAPFLLPPWGVAVAAPEDAGALAGGADDEIATLKRQLELAAGDRFYLLLTAAPPTLRLMFQGIMLREYPVHQLRLGRPRALFRPLRVADEWESRIWTGGRLDPPRRRAQITITPPKPGADSAASGSGPPDKEEEESASNPPESVPIPPNVEEAVPVPRVFRIAFGDLILIVETGDNGRAASPPPTVKSFLRGFRHFWEDRLAWLAPRIVRLRFRLEPPDAAHLYRSLPEDVSLGIVREETPFHAR